MRIKYIALTAKCEQYFTKYLQKKDKHIKNILVVCQRPLTVEVEPKMSFVQQKAISGMMKNPLLKDNLLGEWKNKYAIAMRKEGLTEEDYDMEILM